MTLAVQGLRNPPRSKLRPSRNGKVGGKAVAQFDLLEVGSWESCSLRSFNTLSTSRPPSRFGRVAACCGVGSEDLAPQESHHPVKFPILRAKINLYKSSHPRKNPASNRYSAAAGPTAARTAPRPPLRGGPHSAATPGMAGPSTPVSGLEYPE